MGIIKNFKEVLGLEGSEEDIENIDLHGENENEEGTEQNNGDNKKNISIEGNEDSFLISSVSNIKNQPGQNSENMSEFQTIFVSPTKFEECKKIANYINDEKIITINLEKLSTDSAQRLIDFLSGAMEVKKAKFVTVSKKVYVSVPNGVKAYVEEENSSDIFR